MPLLGPIRLKIYARQQQNNVLEMSNFFKHLASFGGYDFELVATLSTATPYAVGPFDGIA